MNNHHKLETQLEETVALSTKVGLIVGMISAFLVGVAFLLVLFPQPPKAQKVTPQVQVKKEVKTLSIKLEGDDFSQDSLLIKFKPGILKSTDKEQKIKNIVDTALEDPLAILSDEKDQLNIPPENLQTIKAESREINQLFANQVSPQKIKESFKQRTQRIPKDIKDIPDLSGWYVLRLKDKIDKGAIKSLISRLRLSKDDIEAIEPNYIMHANIVPNDPYYSSSGSWGQNYDDMWGLKRIQAQEAWSLFSSSEDIGKGIVVAVSDTGVDYNHEDLHNNIWQNTDEIPGNGIDDDGNSYIDDVQGWDFTTCARFGLYGCVEVKTPDADPIDNHGHGTHVSGTITALTNNSLGVAGINWHTKIMPVQGLNPEGSGYTSELISTIKYAADNGADVINMSWGGYNASGEYFALEEAIDYAHSLGVVLVAAAGNENSNVDSFAPAKFHNVITVAASDSQDVRASFSNYGKIDVTAPGVDILSLRANGTDMYGDGTHVVGNNYYRASGTSMAAPHVSGQAALVLSKYPEFTNEQVRAALIQSSDDLVFSYDCTPFTNVNDCNAQKNDQQQLCIWDDMCSRYLNPRDCTFDFWYGCQWDSTYNRCYNPNATCQQTISNYDSGWDQYTGSGRINAGHALQINNPLVSHINNPNDASYFYNGEQVQITGTATGENFQNYTVEVGQVVNPTTWTSISSSTTPVINGILATWDTTRLLGNYQIRLTVSNEQGESYPDIREVFTGLQQGWPVIQPYSGFETFQHPNAADINNDGKVEVILSMYEAVYGWDFQGKPLNGWPIDPKDNNKNYREVTLGNMDNDQDLEIVFFSAEAHKVHIYHHNGIEVKTNGWPRTLTTSSINLMMADIDKDKADEIVAIDNNKIYAWNLDGTNLTGWPVTLTSRIYGNAVGDVNHDGSMEVVAGVNGSPNTVTVLSYNGQVLSQWQVTEGGGTIVLGDLDNNGDLEIVRSGNTKIHAWHHDGTNVTGWPTNETLADGSTVLLGDLNNDNSLEIITSSGNSLAVWNSSGSLLSNWPLVINGFFNGMNLSLGDINGDGYVEIIAYGFYTYDWSIHAFNVNGAEIEGFPLKLKGNSYVPSGVPLITDLDKDGDVELLFYGTSASPGATMRVYALDLPAAYNAAKIPWPMFQHDPQHSGLYNRCLDYTLFGQCNPATKQYCNNGKLENCSTTTPYCNPTTLACEAKCLDGTPFGKCSGRKPLYCNNQGKLTSGCLLCGCPAGQQCKKTVGFPAGQCIGGIEPTPAL